MPQGYADRTVQRTSGGAATPAQVEALKRIPVGRLLDNPDATVVVDDRETPPARRKIPLTASPSFRLHLPETEAITGDKPKPKGKPIPPPAAPAPSPKPTTARIKLDPPKD